MSSGNETEMFTALMNYLGRLEKTVDSLCVVVRGLVEESPHRQMIYEMYPNLKKEIRRGDL